MVGLGGKSVRAKLLFVPYHPRFCAPFPVCVSSYIFFVFFGIQWGLYSAYSIFGVAERTQDESQNWMRQEVRLFRERGSADAWSVLLGAVAQTLRVAPTLVTQGFTWIFSRALWISPSVRTKTATPSPLPPGSEIRPVHGTGWLTRCARTFQIPIGAIRSKLVATELFSHASSAKLGVAACHSVWALPSRPNFLRCGARYLIVLFPEIDGPCALTTWNDRNFLRGRPAMSPRREPGLDWNRPACKLGGMLRFAIKMGV